MPREGPLGCPGKENPALERPLFRSILPLAPCWARLRTLGSWEVASGGCKKSLSHQLFGALGALLAVFVCSFGALVSVPVCKSPLWERFTSPP